MGVERFVTQHNSKGLPSIFKREEADAIILHFAILTRCAKLWSIQVLHRHLAEDAATKHVLEPSSKN